MQHHRSYSHYTWHKLIYGTRAEYLSLATSIHYNLYLFRHPTRSWSQHKPPHYLDIYRYLQCLELHVQEGGAGDEWPGCPPRPQSWRGADRPTQRRLHSISGSVSGDGVGSPRTRPGFAKRIKKLNELRVNSISGGFTAFQCLQTSNQVWMVILDSCVSSDTFWSIWSGKSIKLTTKELWSYLQCQSQLVRPIMTSRNTRRKKKVPDTP